MNPAAVPKMPFALVFTEHYNRRATLFLKRPPTCASQIIPVNVGDHEAVY